MTKRRYNLPTLCRAYIITLGIGLIGIGISLAINIVKGSATEQLVALLFVLLGIGALIVGFYASDSDTEKWGAALATHEFTLIFVVLALPVYFVLRIFGKKDQ